MLLSQDLGSENRELKKRLQELMSQARRNQDIMGRFRILNYALLAQTATTR